LERGVGRKVKSLECGVGSGKGKASAVAATASSYAQVLRADKMARLTEGFQLLAVFDGIESHQKGAAGTKR
jgi:hypothetical protein